MVLTREQILDLAAHVRHEPAGARIRLSHEHAGRPSTTAPGNLTVRIGRPHGREPRRLSLPYE